MSGKKTRHRRRDEQPGEKVLYDTPLEELWESRGGFLYVRQTAGVKRWMRVITRPGVPHCGEDVVVFLSGTRSGDETPLGSCRRASHRRRRLGIILLDDPDPRWMKRLDGVIGRHVPKTFTPRRLRRAWDAYLLEVYLHELGHWQHIRAGREPGEQRADQEAERFAWKWMEKLLPREEVLGALALNWITDIT